MHRDGRRRKNAQVNIKKTKKKKEKKERKGTKAFCPCVSLSEIERAAASLLSD